jgi:hypothetical protein
MKKSDRLKVFNKFGGRCSYCGCELPERGWHLDHLLPVNRLQKRIAECHRHKITKEKIEKRDLPERWFNEYERVPEKIVFDRFQFPERDTVENAMPSCASCNNYKMTFGIEIFRRELGLLVGRLNKTFTQYRIAKRFGLVQETGIEVKFYYENFQPPVQ